MVLPSTVELGIGSLGFCGGRKTGVQGEKPSEQGRDQQQTQPTHNVDFNYSKHPTILDKVPGKSRKRESIKGCEAKRSGSTVE